MMTHKERMLKAARGEWPDKLPWAPRLDLWYNSNSLYGTLPPEYQGYTLEQIYDALGVAHHRIVPEFLNVRSEDDNIDRGLGLYRLWGMAYRVELQNVERVVKKEGEATVVEYRTPIGSVSCKILYTEEMRRAGASITWIEEHIIKKPEDYKVVGYIFRNLKVTPDYDNYRQYQERVGDRGFAAAFANLSASPMHHIMKEFMSPTQFYLELYDHPKELEQLCEDMEPYFDSVFHILADSPAEVVFSGANFDEMLTYPPFFEKYIMPYLQKLSSLLHEKGKLLLCHCDGENQGLLHLLAESGIDIAEAICPQPMTKCTISEIKKAFRDKVTIFGGVPSVVLEEESMTDEEFEAFMRRLFKEIAPGYRFILGVADTVPANAKFSRIKRIGEMVDEWGMLPMKI